MFTMYMAAYTGVCKPTGKFTVLSTPRLVELKVPEHFLNHETVKGN